MGRRNNPQQSEQDAAHQPMIANVKPTMRTAVAEVIDARDQPVLEALMLWLVIQC
jgi:hypothetical protein